MIFMANRTTDGFSDEVRHFGGRAQIAVTGTFDGATATLEVKQDGQAFIPLDETLAMFTFVDVVNFDMNPGTTYQLNVTDVGASTDLTASAI